MNEDISLKYYKMKPFIAVILLLSWGLDFGIKGILLPIMYNYNLDTLRIPSNLIIIGGFILFYNHVLWKLPIFNLLVGIPNLNGRYEGKIEYDWENVPSSKKCVVEIRQTASEINMSFFFNDNKGQKTNSSSRIAEIRKEPDGHYYIYIFYYNEGTKMNKELAFHEGANILKFIPKNGKVQNKLSGHYFTRRNPQTMGKMDVKFVSKETKGEF